MALSSAAAGGARAEPARLAAEADKGQLVVRVYEKGLLSGLAHDHEFAATRFRATVTLDEAGSSTWACSSGTSSTCGEEPGEPDRAPG